MRAKHTPFLYKFCFHLSLKPQRSVWVFSPQALSIVFDFKEKKSIFFWIGLPYWCTCYHLLMIYSGQEEPEHNTHSKGSTFCSQSNWLESDFKFKVLQSFFGSVMLFFFLCVFVLFSFLFCFLLCNFQQQCKGMFLTSPLSLLAVVVKRF